MAIFRLNKIMDEYVAGWGTQYTCSAITLNIALDVVERPPGQKGFQVLPRRWVVERTFGWLGRYRRVSKDYERCTKSSEGVIYIASAHTMLRRVASHG